MATKTKKALPGLEDGWTKQNADFVKLAKAGSSIVGVFEKEYVKAWNEEDEVTGEVVEKKSNVYLFADPETGQKFQMWEDGGLKMHAPLIKTPGLVVKIVKTGQKELDSGRRCNTYDVYTRD